MLARDTPRYYMTLLRGNFAFSVDYLTLGFIFRFGMDRTVTLSPFSDASSFDPTSDYKMYVSPDVTLNGDFRFRL